MTGGAGTLGKAIANKRKEAGWTGKLTVYSTDAGKHNAMRGMYPDVHFIQGDIRNLEAMKLAMAGHDVVIHAAAVKFIPDSEIAPIDTIDVNVNGSLFVCQAAREAGIKSVMGISTDKACHPANAYGSTKHLMEKIFQEQARYGGGTTFVLIRYGNVLESRGSVLEAWQNAIENGKPLRVTNLDMSRFWLSPAQAAEYVEQAFEVTPNGLIYIPKMPALDIRNLIAYYIGAGVDPGIENVPMRPGEKLHETLLTEEETEYAKFFETDAGDFFMLRPSYEHRSPVDDHTPYTSANAPQLTRDDLQTLLKDG